MALRFLLVVLNQRLDVCTNLTEVQVHVLQERKTMVERRRGRGGGKEVERRRRGRRWEEKGRGRGGRKGRRKRRVRRGGR